LSRLGGGFGLAAPEHSQPDALYSREQKDGMTMTAQCCDRESETVLIAVSDVDTRGHAARARQPSKKKTITSCAGYGSWLTGKEPGRRENRLNGVEGY